MLQAMAEVHLLRREAKAAVELYDELLEHQPDSPKLWNERGVALHQDGKFAEAEESYRRAVQAELGYALAHNNLGVALYHRGNTEEAVAAFRVALDAQPTFIKARLNLALLLSKGKRFQLALEAYRTVLQTAPEDPGGVERRRASCSRSCASSRTRATRSRARSQARPEYAEAHYNLSFTLSNLGDFEGALRETKRALELDPYYVAQKFELAIDLEYEDPDLSIQPDLGAVHRTEENVEDFAFDAGVLDSLFTTLAPTAPQTDGAEHASTPRHRTRTRWRRDYLGMGLYERAAAEVSRALLRGAPRVDGYTLLGDIYSRQGVYGEALERYREAQARSARHACVRAIGEASALLAMGRGGEARPLAEALLCVEPAADRTC